MNYHNGWEHFPRFRNEGISLIIGDFELWNLIPLLLWIYPKLSRKIYTLTLRWVFLWYMRHQGHHFNGPYKECISVLCSSKSSMIRFRPHYCSFPHFKKDFRRIFIHNILSMVRIMKKVILLHSTKSPIIRLMPLLPSFLNLGKCSHPLW